MLVVEVVVPNLDTTCRGLTARVCLQDQKKLARMFSYFNYQTDQKHTDKRCIHFSPRIHSTRERSIRPELVHAEFDVWLRSADHVADA